MRQFVSGMLSHVWECLTGSVLIVDDQQRLTGIFTGRDAVRTLAEGKNPEITTLEQAMTPNTITISPDCRAIEALRQMSDHVFAIFQSLRTQRSGAWCRGVISREWRSIS